MVVSNHPSQPSWSANTLDNSIHIEFVGIHVRRFQIDLNDDFSVCALSTIFDYKMVLSSVVDEGPIIKGVPLADPVGYINHATDERVQVLAGRSHVVLECGGVWALEEYMVHVFDFVVAVVSYGSIWRPLWFRTWLAVSVEKNPLLVLLTFHKGTISTLAYRSIVGNQFISNEVVPISFVYSSFHTFLNVLPPILDVFPEHVKDVSNAIGVLVVCFVKNAKVICKEKIMWYIPSGRVAFVDFEGVEICMDLDFSKRGRGRHTLEGASTQGLAKPD
uniref:Uncharacterized protein n=1 Tax=Solanum lycopersicum TaxID=4081 RepID=K4CD50_SOLLC